MKFITSEDELELNEGKSIVHFYASWFLHHSPILRILAPIEEERPNIKFYAVDIDAFPSYKTRYNLSSLPTVIIFKDGCQIRRLTALETVANIKAKLADIDLKEGKQPIIKENEYAQG